MDSPSSSKLRFKKQINDQSKREESEMDNATGSKRKNTTLTTKKKRSRVLAVDISWCLNNIESLSVMAFAREFKHSDQHYCHSRYKTIIENHIPLEEWSRLNDDFNNWRKTLIFWKEQKRVYALSEVDSNRSEEVSDSAENFHKPIVANTTTSSSATKEIPIPEALITEAPKPEAPISATSETPAPGTVNATTSSAFTIDFSNNELDLKHYILDGSDIITLFRQYQNRANKIARPITLETNIKELLALSDVLFLAKNQHSSIKTSFFSEELLDNNNS